MCILGVPIGVNICDKRRYRISREFVLILPLPVVFPLLVVFPPSIVNVGHSLGRGSIVIIDKDARRVLPVEYAHSSIAWTVPRLVLRARSAALNAWACVVPHFNRFLTGDIWAFGAMDWMACL